MLLSEWGILGLQLIMSVLSFVQIGILDRNISEILVTLIPNVDAPENIFQFRLISLYNVSYKVITKVLSNRLRKVLPYLISKNQCSFIPSC